jgi:hypothetical protein
MHHCRACTGEGPMSEPDIAVCAGVWQVYIAVENSDPPPVDRQLLICFPGNPVRGLMQ